jgi:hypothetical protein
MIVNTIEFPTPIGVKCNMMPFYGNTKVGKIKQRRCNILLFFIFIIMDLQENINRIQSMMGIISEVKSSYTVKQIEKGLNKSAKDNDVTINTSIDNVINNIDKFEFQIGSVEAFLDDENSFTSDSLVEKLISYVKDKNLNIDISKLIEYNNYRREHDKNDDRVFELLYNTHPDDDYTEEIEKLYNRNDELYKYFDLLKQETLKIKQEILNLE